MNTRLNFFDNFGHHDRITRTDDMIDASLWNSQPQHGFRRFRPQLFQFLSFRKIKIRHEFTQTLTVDLLAIIVVAFDDFLLIFASICHLLFL